MEYKDDFREKMIALDEIGFIGNPRARHTEKKDRIISAYFQVARKMWKEEGRCLTEEEKNEVLRAAELAYNREVRQRRKIRAQSMVAVL